MFYQSPNNSHYRKGKMVNEEQNTSQTILLGFSIQHNYLIIKVNFSLTTWVHVCLEEGEHLCCIT